MATGTDYVIDKVDKIDVLTLHEVLTSIVAILPASNTSSILWNTTNTKRYLRKPISTLERIRAHLVTGMPP